MIQRQIRLKQVNGALFDSYAGTKCKDSKNLRIKKTVLNNLKSSPMQNLVFSVKNIESVVKSISFSKSENRSAKSQKICNEIKNTFENTISKPIEKTSLIHIQFGHPLKVQADKQSEYINRNIAKYNPEVNTVILDIDSGRVLTSFDLFNPISQHSASKQILINEVMNINVNSNKYKANLDAYWMPYGMTFKCFFFKGKFIISTFTIPRMNESNFGGSDNLESILEKILNRNGSSFEYFDQKTVYTLHLQMKQFSGNPQETDELWIYNIESMYSGFQQYKDPLYNCLKTLDSVNIHFPDTFDGKFVRNVLFGKNSQFMKMFDRFDSEVLMQSLVICVDNKQFEVITPVKEFLIQFNVFRSQNSNNKDTQQLLREFMLKQEMYGNENTYFRNHLKYVADLPIYIPVRNTYLKFQSKEKFIKYTQETPEWKQNVAGIIIHEFLKEMHKNVRYPLFIGSNSESTQDDHLKRLPKLVGVMLTLEDNQLIDMLFNHTLIIKHSDSAKFAIFSAESQ